MNPPTPGRRMTVCDGCGRTKLMVPGPCECGGTARASMPPTGQAPDAPPSLTPPGLGRDRSTRVPRRRTRLILAGGLALTALATLATQADRFSRLVSGDETAPTATPVSAAAPPHDDPRAVSFARYRTLMASACRAEYSARSGLTTPTDRERGFTYVVELDKAIPGWTSRLKAITPPPKWWTLHSALVASYERAGIATATFHRQILDEGGGTTVTRTQWLTEMARDRSVQVGAYTVLDVPACTSLIRGEPAAPKRSGAPSEPEKTTDVT